jgi:hypothetical protein
MKFYETFATLSLFLFTTGNAALPPVQADHHVEKSNSIDAVVAHKQRQQRILNSIVGLSGARSSRVLVSDQCLFDAAVVMAQAALDSVSDPSRFEKETENSCKEYDGKVVKVSVDFTDPTCVTTTDVGVIFSVFDVFCVPGSCGGSSAQDVVTEYVNIGIEGQENPPANDSCKDVEVKVADTSAAGAQSQYLSSLSFFLVQGVVVSSFMVVML